MKVKDEKDADYKLFTPEINAQLAFARDHMQRSKDFIVRMICKVVDGFASVDHNNGPGCSWGGLLQS